MGRRPQDGRVEHSRQADVAGELGLARDLGPGVRARDRLPGYGVGGPGLDGGLAVRTDLDAPAADELGVGRPAGRFLGDADGAVPGLQGLFGRPQPGRGQLDQDAAGLGRRLAQGRPEVLGAARAERARVVRAEVRVAHDHVHGLERDVELLGQHHGQGGHDALAHLDLAGEAGHPAVRADREVGVEVLGIASVGAAGAADLGLEAVPDGEEDDQAAAGELEEVPPLEGRAVRAVAEHRELIVPGSEGSIALHGRSPSSSYSGRPPGRP